MRAVTNLGANIERTSESKKYTTRAHEILRRVVYTRETLPRGVTGRGARRVRRLGRRAAHPHRRQGLITCLQSSACLSASSQLF
jgi:hypothetical protein